MGSAEAGYQFECQHGPDECYGNLVQACTIAHAPDYDTTVNLIVCMMSASRPNEAGPDCFQENGLDYQPILVNDYKCGRKTKDIVVRIASRVERAPAYTQLTGSSRGARAPR